MKKLLYLFALAGLLLSSCNDYLNVVPKGERIPTTLVDFEALLYDEYNINTSPVLNALYLLNDRYMTPTELSTPTLERANYLWDETADRIALNNEGEMTYYMNYAAISSCNLLIENVPTATDGTEEERARLIAYAKVIRAISFFNLVNFYADTYDAATAAETRAVPLITSANVGAPSRQASVAEIYDFMLRDVQEALEGGLPDETPYAVLPNVGAAYAFLARVYLQMGNYTEALRNADLALAEKSDLYDWNAFYDDPLNQGAFMVPDLYEVLMSPMDYTYCENYYFRAGDRNTNQIYAEFNIPVERGARFEEGDARFLSRWKIDTDETNDEPYYHAMCMGYFNYNGLTTTEVYLIKAECEARLAANGDFTEAMNALNAVREKRIRPDVYQPATASTLAEAIELIRRTKDNELIFSIVPFADARRFNREGTYARTMTKTYNDRTLTLSPESHLWTMPFPAGAVNNPGNGTLEQNVER